MKFKEYLNEKEETAASASLESLFDHYNFKYNRTSYSSGTPRFVYWRRKGNKSVEVSGETDKTYKWYYYNNPEGMNVPKTTNKFW